MASRLSSAPWSEIGADLDRAGWARIRAVLDAGECAALAALYDRDERFRKTVSMDRQRFGSGEYRYFAEPLPRLVSLLRADFYRHLVPIANRWARRLGRANEFPASLRQYRRQCHRAGQRRPTPLLLRYEEGGYNRMHQDLYGARAFPLQVVIPLSRPGGDYEGGEFLLSEQAPRMQARVAVLKPERGDAIVFPNAERPVRGARGDYRVRVRHGAGTITRGRRLALGLIFHDAE